MRAWVVCMKRKLPEAGALSIPLLELHILQVPVDSLATLAFSLKSHSLKDRSWFLTPDGPLIMGALSSIGVSPLQCRVKFVKQSMDRVYFLNVPVHAKGTPFKVLSSVPTLALKVVGGSRYYQEARALKKIAASGEIKEFYALGAAPSTSAVWFQEKEEPWRELSSNVDDGWWNVQRSYEGRGGVIIMRPGREMVPEGALCDRRAIVDGVKKTLAAAHSCGIVHTDIRCSNILYFDPVDENGSGGWQLVDFGLSVAENSTVNLQVHSYRARNAGYRIHRLLASSHRGTVLECTWSRQDDIEMVDGLKV